MGQDVVKFYLNKKRQPDSVKYDDEPIYLDNVKIDKLLIGKNWVLTVNKNDELIVT